MNEQQNSSGTLGIISLVLAIFSLLLFCTGPIAFLMAILAIVLACVEKKKTSPRFIGLVIGIISIILSLAIMLMYYLGLSILGSVGKFIMDNPELISETLESRQEELMQESDYAYNYTLTNSSSFLGTWETEKNSYTDYSKWEFSYTKAWNFFDESNDNYAAGTYEVYEGKEGLLKAEVSEVYINDIFINRKIPDSAVYLISIKPTDYIKNGEEQDVSKLGNTINYIWILKYDRSYNLYGDVIVVATGKTYSFSKTQNTISMSNDVFDIDKLEYNWDEYDSLSSSKEENTEDNDGPVISFTEMAPSPNGSSETKSNAPIISNNKWDVIYGNVSISINDSYTDACKKIDSIKHDIDWENNGSRWYNYNISIAGLNGKVEIIEGSNHNPKFTVPSIAGGVSIGDSKNDIIAKLGMPSFEEKVPNSNKTTLNYIIGDVSKSWIMKSGYAVTFNLEDDILTSFIYQNVDAYGQENYVGPMFE